MTARLTDAEVGSIIEWAERFLSTPHVLSNAETERYHLALEVRELRARVVELESETANMRKVWVENQSHRASLESELVTAQRRVVELEGVNASLKARGNQAYEAGLRDGKVEEAARELERKRYGC
ncbi:MAG TPA: hypothetical protein VFZ21_30835 [Gemmatimonadaceae bacterium]|nr:hypothetical protein [Gemmatimonadaceae bacterium]